MTPDNSTVALIDSWLERTSDELSFSPGPVQDLMFEIWPETPEGSEARELVQQWLTLTVHRNLVGNQELRDALTELRSSFLVPVVNGA